MSTPAEQLDALLTALAVLVASQAGTAKVYTYDRYLEDGSAIESLLGVSDSNFSKGWSVRYWTLDRAATSEAPYTNDEVVQVHTIRMRAYWEVYDAGNSRAAFRTAIENVRTLLRTQPEMAPDLPISGVAGGVQANLPIVELFGPPQVSTDADVVVIGETYLCHHAEISMQAQVRLPYT